MGIKDYYYYYYYSVIHALEMLLDFRKAKNHSPSGSCFFTLSESLATSRVHGSRYPARKTIWYSFIIISVIYNEQFDWLTRVQCDTIMHCGLSPLLCSFCFPPLHLCFSAKNINKTIELLKYTIYQKATRNRPN